MRVVDLLLPYLEGLERVVEAYSGGVVLRSYLGPASSLSYEKTPPDTARTLGLKETDLMLALIGPPSAVHDDIDLVLPMLRHLAPNGVGLILTGWQPEDIPMTRLVQAATRHSCQLLQFGELDYELIRAGVVLARAEHLQAPRFLYGRRVDDGEGDSLALQLRVANELLAESFIHRSTRRRVRELERSTTDLEVERARSAALEARLAEIMVEKKSEATDKKAREAAASSADNEIRAYRVKLAKAHRQIELLENATGLKLGKAIGGAAHGPMRDRLRLPAELFRILRERHEPAPSTRTRGRLAAGRKKEAPDQHGAAAAPQYLRYVQVQVRPTPELPSDLTVAAILRPRSRAALQEHCVVNLLRPHDALEVLEATQPDFVLVEEAALNPGLPWAGAGNTTSAERDRQLQAISDATLEFGIPVALWTNGRPGQSPGLRHLMPNAKQVAGFGLNGSPGWSTGVPLRRFNPIGLADDRPMKCLMLAPAFDPGHRILQRWVQVVSREVGSLPVWHEVDEAVLHSEPMPDQQLLLEDEAPGLFRKHGCAVLPPAARGASGAQNRAGELVACGVRVLDSSTDGLFGGGRRAVTDLDNLRGILAEVIEEGPRRVSGIWGDLRHVFSEGSTRVMLGRLADTIGVDNTVLATRRVSAIASALSTQLIENVRRQTVRPFEVIVTSGERSYDRGREELEGIGVQVHELQGRGDDWWSRGVDAASAPWVSPWTDEVTAGSGLSREWLRDQLVAAEASGAEIIGQDNGRSWRFTADVTARAPLFSRAVLNRNNVEGEFRAADVIAESYRRGTPVFSFVAEDDARGGG